MATILLLINTLAILYLLFIKGKPAIFSIESYFDHTTKRVEYEVYFRETYLFTINTPFKKL
jgi:hypothetical protein